MNVFVRVDSSEKIGSGHLMRCLTLADQLRNNGAHVFFISRELSGNMCSFAEKKEYIVHRLPQVNDEMRRTVGYSEWLGTSWQRDAQQTLKVLHAFDKFVDLLIIDHYGLDKQWEEQIRPYVKKVMVIDDLADRAHDCDLLLDQNLYKDINNRYEGLVPEHCLKLLGPKYALLRLEFIKARRNLRERNGVVRRILVFFGGSDPTNETAKAMEALKIINRPDIAIDVVVGSANPRKEQIARICSTMPNTSFYCQVDNMAQLMAKADLAIGAGGSTTWERCFLGLPTITLIVADNQAETTKAVSATGAIWNLGWSVSVLSEDIAEAIKTAIDKPELLQQMGLKAMNLMGSLLHEHENAVLKVLLEDKYASL